jgi:hypothetical protein
VWIFRISFYSFFKFFAQNRKNLHFTKCIFLSVFASNLKKKVGSPYLIKKNLQLSVLYMCKLCLHLVSMTRSRIHEHTRYNFAKVSRYDLESSQIDVYITNQLQTAFDHFLFMHCLCH